MGGFGVVDGGVVLRGVEEGAAEGGVAGSGGGEEGVEGCEIGHLGGDVVWDSRVIARVCWRLWRSKGRYPSGCTHCATLTFVASYGFRDCDNGTLLGSWLFQQATLLAIHHSITQVIPWTL